MTGRIIASMPTKMENKVTGIGREQTLEEGVIDEIESLMFDHAFWDGDDLDFHCVEKWRADLEAILISYGEEVLHNGAHDYVQDVGGRPE